ncbi:polyprenyl synthetase family protein [Amycolatopsis speibonae]|uniref:Polyprenyl synthetase family protein n=1 Tax=Amycolatopsis speibonae TaxID=1450224 RepID=A0ABV7P6V9_9PSEU
MDDHLYLSRRQSIMLLEFDGSRTRELLVMANPTVTGVPAVPAALERARETSLPVLRRAIATLHPDLAAVAGYHCGLTDQHGRPVTAGGGGKMLRPALVLLSARTTETPARTSPSEAVVAGAGAVQLVHEFSLLHDDIMDRDRTRRGRATAWTVYGTDTALLAGDVVMALAISMLGDHPPAAAALAEAVVCLCAGQAEDLALGTRSAVTVADWERMATGKTGALIAASCRVGALLGGGDDGIATALSDIGEHLGLAFQAVDDWLGIWGNSAATGKPVGADIAARKRSLPITATLSTPGAASQTLAAILDTPGNLTVGDIAEAIAALDHANAGEFTRHHAQRHTTHIRTALGALDLPPEVRRDWDDLVTFLTTRTT